MLILIFMYVKQGPLVLGLNGICTRTFVYMFELLLMFSSKSQINSFAELP